jgi:RNA polymerase sigma factor (sigma-70 family)
MRKRARAMGLAPDVCKELIQIALVQLWEKGEAVAPACWPAWMTTALRLRLRQWQRSFRLRAKHEPEIALVFEELQAPVVPEEAAYQRECAREVEGLLGRVAGERQAVARLHVGEGLTLKETADELCLNYNTVRGRWNRRP